MHHILQEILDWSEAWAPLVPLLFFLAFRPRRRWVWPVVLFLVLAFFINLASDLIWKRYRLGMGEWMYTHFRSFYNTPPPGEREELSNQVLYNIHAILRYLGFAFFFHSLSRIFRRMNFILVPLFMATLLVVFTGYRDIRDLSSLLMATDSALLLVYCLVYYFLLLKDERGFVKNNTHFWVVFGLSIYVVINFPIFLFYSVVSETAENFAITIWDLHNITYIIFCIFLAKAFHAARRPGEDLLTYKRHA